MKTIDIEMLSTVTGGAGVVDEKNAKEHVGRVKAAVKLCDEQGFGLANCQAEGAKAAFPSILKLIPGGGI